MQLERAELNSVIGALSSKWQRNEMSRLLVDPIRFCFDRIPGLTGLNVVDMGCGGGVISVILAMHGASIIGFDKDLQAIRRAKELSVRFGVQDRCNFFCSASESMGIATGCADIVFSRGTLQYMDRKSALDECKRILAPGGTLVLVENLPYNPFIGLFRLLRRLRARTPEAVAYVRSIRGYLTFEEINNLRADFATLDHREYHLFRMFSMALSCPFESRSWFEAIDGFVARLDSAVMANVPFTRRLAWLAAIVATHKAASESAP